MNWKLLDELVASFVRPYQMFVCSTSLAVSLPLGMYLKVDAIALGAIAASVAGVAGGTAVLRTIDKKTAANAATTTAQVVTPSGSATMTQGVQPDAVPPAPPITPAPVPPKTTPKMG